MPRQAREFRRGYVYHLFNRGHDHAKVFHRREHYELFIDSIEATRVDGFDMLALSLLPNHFHLGIYVWEPQVISPWMQRFLTRFGRNYRARWGGCGPIWQGRTHSVEIDRDSGKARLVEYIEMNPVRARLVGRPEDWHWSSANEQLRRAHPWIKTDPWR